MTGTGSVLISAKCNKCQHLYPEYWVTRDFRGIPSLEGAVCSLCGSKNCISRNWEDNPTHAIVPPLEDGNINRFEYSYTNENGKTINKKMNPKDVQKHYDANYKGK